MASKIQEKHLDEIRAKTTKKRKKNYEAKYGVVEWIQNQNGVVFFSNLKVQRKWFLDIINLDIHDIGYILQK